MNEFSDIFDMIDEFNDIARKTVMNTMTECSAEQLGLDRRAGNNLYVNEDYMAIQGGTRSLDYYGGFEYVEKEFVSQVGDWTFYSSGDERVAECIQEFFSRELG